uniref:Uncharacterized protein n=1 Tax=Anguilla anguilla TaxID=7936 RepID=A0A0E9RYG2_ANGAN
MYEINHFCHTMQGSMQEQACIFKASVKFTQKSDFTNLRVARVVFQLRTHSS